MSGKGILIIGGTGSGKSTFLKKLLSGANPDSIFLWDINNEHTEFTRGKPLLPFEQFSLTARQVKNGIIVFEEATIFLNNRGSSEDVRDILVRKRHTNNMVFLIFHSVRTVPRYVFDLCNYSFIFKTTDNPEFCADRFEREELKTVIERVRNAPPYYYERFNHY